MPVPAEPLVADTPSPAPRTAARADGRLLALGLVGAELLSLAGVYGLSALVVAVNASLAYAAVERGREGGRAAAVTLLVVAGIALWGAARLRDGHLLRSGRPVVVGLVQGNVPQDLKWDPRLEDEILDKYLRNTREAVARLLGLA
jgi:apolipoprotein N-acyltransferase